jgi:hypothetical protein
MRKASELHVFEEFACSVLIDAGFLCVGEDVLSLPGVHLFDQLAPGRIDAPG